MSKYFNFKGYNCKVEISKYRFNDSIAILLTSENGEPIATASVCVEDVELAEGRVLIKDYSENSGMLKCLVDNGIVKDTGIKHPTGWVEVHECILLL